MSARRAKHLRRLALIALTGSTRRRVKRLPEHAVSPELIGWSNEHIAQFNREQENDGRDDEA